MKNLLSLTAVGEAVTGLILLVYPPIVARWLFGAEISGVGVVFCRITGISLVALGLACWPGRDRGRRAAWPICGMLTYSFLVTVYLAYLGIGGEWVGKLLWPVVILHAILTVLLASVWFNEQTDSGNKNTESKTPPSSPPAASTNG